MAIQHKDRLEALLGMPVSDRVLDFVWLATSLKGPNSPIRAWLPSAPGFRDQLASLIHQDRAVANQILSALQIAHVHDEQLSWISGEHRQAPWMLRNLFNIAASVGLNAPQIDSAAIPIHLRGRALALALFDYAAAAAVPFASAKLAAFNDAVKSAWVQQCESDRIFAWLDGDDERQFILNRLKEDKVGTSTFVPRFHTHEDLLLFFDGQQLSAIEKKFIVEKARKTWIQKVRRAGSKDRRQCNFVLLDSTVKKLAQLAESTRLSRTEILEVIIDSEFKDQHHVRKLLTHRQALLTGLQEAGGSQEKLVRNRL
jgi:hypothetical protein